jgi:hypothetical protein
MSQPAFFVYLTHILLKSCAEMVVQCELFVRDGLFQSEVCVMASFCYAESTTDILLNNIYPYYWTDIPTTLDEARLSKEVWIPLLYSFIHGQNS